MTNYIFKWFDPNQTIEVGAVNKKLSEISEGSKLHLVLTDIDRYMSNIPTYSQKVKVAIKQLGHGPILNISIVAKTDKEFSHSLKILDGVLKEGTGEYQNLLWKPLVEGISNIVDLRNNILIVCKN